MPDRIRRKERECIKSIKEEIITMASKKINSGKGWAWELEEGTLCYWAEPTKEQLRARSSPSTDAKPLPVRIVREADWRKIMKRLEILDAIEGGANES
jgi:hypothetical protein